MHSRSGAEQCQSAECVIAIWKLQSILNLLYVARNLQCPAQHQGLETLKTGDIKGLLTAGFGGLSCTRCFLLVCFVCNRPVPDRAKQGHL